MKFIDANDLGFTSSAAMGAFKGAVQGLENKRYHALDKYWSSTQLKYLANNSPAHFREEYFTKDDEEQKSSEDLILGSLVHTLILEPNSFEKEYFVMPDFNNRTNEGKAAKQEILANNPGKAPITQEMLVQANLMRSSVQMNKSAMDLLTPTQKEVSFFWTCPFSQLNFRAKIDGLNENYFVELKTSRSAKPDSFSKDLFDLGYDLSAVHYQQGIKSFIQKDLPAYFIVVEKKPPFVTQVYKASEGLYATGHGKWLDAVTKLENGIKKEVWPGYFPDGEIPEIGPPAWAMRPYVNMIGDANGI